MHAANNKGIKIIGAVILRFSGRSKSGKIFETRLIVYVPSDSDKLFLSQETCTAPLGVISQNFPSVGETLQACDLWDNIPPADVPHTPEIALTAP